MVTMSFGEHIEELRVRLILALIGLFVGVIVVFIPPLDIGWRVMKKMEEPAKVGPRRVLPRGIRQEGRAGRAGEGDSHAELQAVVDADTFVAELKKIAPKLELPEAESLKGKTLNLPIQFFAAGMIEVVQSSTVQIDQSLVSLAPLETLTIFFMVCLVSRAGAGQSLGVLSDLGVRRRRAVPARAELREEIPAVLAGPVPRGRVPLLLLRAAASP